MSIGIGIGKSAKSKKDLWDMFCPVSENGMVLGEDGFGFGFWVGLGWVLGVHGWDSTMIC